MIQFKFYDPKRADGLSSDYISLTLPAAASTPPYILPVRVSTIKVVNTPTETYKIRVTLLN